MRVRDGFQEFVELARDRGWRVVIVSSGFHELIEPILEREGVEVELHANRVDPRTDGWRVELALRRDLRLLRGVVQALDRAGAGRGRRARLHRRRLLRPLRGRGLRPRLRDPRPGGLPRCTGVPYEPSTTSTTSLAVSLPEPFDFGLSTERFRAFGADLANLWHDGGAPPRLRRDARCGSRQRPGGVLIEPGDSTLAGRRRGATSARPFDLDAFNAFAATEPVLAAHRPGARAASGRRSRPTRTRRLVTSITAQQISLRAAFAVRNRFIQAFGERVRSSRTPFRRASGSRRRSRRSFSHSASRAARPSTRSGSRGRDLDLDGLAALPDDEVKAALTALRGHRRVDRGLVPRPPSRPPRRVARRRPRPAEGGAPLLRRGGHACRRRPLCRAPQPGGALPAHGP